MSHLVSVAKTISAEALEAGGLTLWALFGRRAVAWRSVNAVTGDAVELLLGERSVWVARTLLPRGVQAGQWLRFERQREGIAVSVDLRTTAAAEARLSGLFEALTAQPGSAST